MLGQLGDALKLVVMADELGREQKLLPKDMEEHAVGSSHGLNHVITKDAQVCLSSIITCNVANLG